MPRCGKKSHARRRLERHAALAVALRGDRAVQVRRDVASGPELVRRAAEGRVTDVTLRHACVQSSQCSARSASGHRAGCACAARTASLELADRRGERCEPVAASGPGGVQRQRARADRPVHAVVLQPEPQRRVGRGRRVQPCPRAQPARAPSAHPQHTLSTADSSKYCHEGWLRPSTVRLSAAHRRWRSWRRASAW